MCCTFIYRLFQIYLLTLYAACWTLDWQTFPNASLFALHWSHGAVTMLFTVFLLCGILVQHKHNHLASSGGGMCFFPSQDQPEQAAYTQKFIQAIFWGWAASDWPIKSCLETEQHIFSSMFSWHFWIFSNHTKIRFSCTLGYSQPPPPSATYTPCPTSLLTSSPHTDKVWNQKFQIWIHHAIRSVATDYQSSSYEN